MSSLTGFQWFAATSSALTRFSIAVVFRFDVCGRPMLISHPIIAVAEGTFIGFSSWMIDYTFVGSVVASRVSGVLSTALLTHLMSTPRRAASALFGLVLRIEATPMLLAE